MGTSLFILTNSKLNGNEREADWERIRNQLVALNWEQTSIYQNGKYIQETGEWVYYLNNVASSNTVAEFEGPFNFTPDFYMNIGVIHSIYRYALLYEIHHLDWFTTFRKSVFDLVQIMGGTEVIYVADNACDKLSEYVGMAWENTAYEQIKERMILELGIPVTDYSQLDVSKLDYRQITEFVFDDFGDLKIRSK